MDWDSDPELKRLQREFVASFSERGEALSLAVSRLEDAADRQDAQEIRDSLQSLEFLCHRIAGVAESFGFSALGKLAGDIELQLMHGGENTPPKQIVQQTRQLVAALESEQLAYLR